MIIQLKSKIKKNHKRAFSLVEVMISIFLVSVGLLASLSLLSIGLRETMDSRNQVIGSLLAQEGVELVRALRDKNWANGEFSFKGMDNTGAQKYIMDYNDTVLVGATASCANCRLSINSENFYNHGSGTSTKFLRKIYIVYTIGNPLEVISFVTWDGDGNKIFNIATSDCNTASKCAYSRDVLTDWGE